MALMVYPYFVENTYALVAIESSINSLIPSVGSDYESLSLI